MMELFYGFASAKCKKNALELKRDPRKLKWTKNTLKVELERSKID